VAVDDLGAEGGRGPIIEPPPAGRASDKRLLGVTVTAAPALALRMPTHDDLPPPRGRTALITGCAGFLGSHLAEALVSAGWSVHGVDAFTGYYARPTKERNLAVARMHPRFRCTELDLATDDLSGLLDGIDVVFHLAAQPGVRASFGDGLRTYLANNVLATQRLLEQAARTGLEAFVYASSSSIYGDQPIYPVAEHAAPMPVSPYGATKVITEQLAGAFWRSHGVPVVGLRYFTVYGPRQRPDMAFCRFLHLTLDGRPIQVLGDGHQVREFTYVADVVAATIAAAHSGERGAVYNIGGGAPVSVLGAIEMLERLLRRTLAVEHAPAGAGDPRCTHADVTRARRDLDFAPQTSLLAGMAAQLDAMSGARIERVAA
jgi:UDP-glucose 4-epimerase